MSALPSDIRRAVDAEKSLGRTPEWDDKTDRNYIVFTAPLQVAGGISLGGLELRAKVAKRFVARDAMMQLEYAPTARRSVPLWRCQWRPFERHVNKGWGPPDFELATILTTHEHRFDHNFHEAECRMRGSNLPAAVPVNPDPGTLSEFIAFCGDRFRITDIRRIRPPPVSPDLFWVPL